MDRAHLTGGRAPYPRIMLLVGLLSLGATATLAPHAVAAEHAAVDAPAAADVDTDTGAEVDGDREADADADPSDQHTPQAPGEGTDPDAEPAEDGTEPDAGPETETDEAETEEDATEDDVIVRLVGPQGALETVLGAELTAALDSSVRDLAIERESSLEELALALEAGDVTDVGALLVILVDLDLIELAHQLVGAIAHQGDHDELIGSLEVLLTVPELTTAVADLAADLVATGDVAQVRALLAELDGLDADVLADADVRAGVDTVLDAMLTALAAAIDGDTLDLETQQQIIVAVLENDVLGAELLRRLDAGELDTTLATAVGAALQTITPAPESPAEPDTPEAPAEPDTPEAPGEPDAPGVPEQQPGTGETPEVPETGAAAPSPSDIADLPAPEADGQRAVTASPEVAATTGAATQTDGAPAGQLPVTGGDALQLALVAVASLLAGGLALATTRRRTSHG